MKKLLLLALLTMNASSLMAQRDLAQVEFIRLQNKARMFINSDIDSSFLYAEKIELSRNRLHRAFAKGLKSYLYQLYGDPEKSSVFYNEAQNLMKEVPDSREKKVISAHLHNYEGLASWKRNNLNEALESYWKGKKISESIADTRQVVKFNNNISLVNIELGNYKGAVNSLKESEQAIENSARTYKRQEFMNSMSSINLYLGNAYEKYFHENKSMAFLLDSAVTHYEKSIVYSKELADNRVSAQINIANIYKIRKEFKKAEKSYFELMRGAKERGNGRDYYNVAYNLGELLYVQKKFDQALVCFGKVDSIYAEKSLGELEFVHSSYYQAKIYEETGQDAKALAYSERYLRNYEKLQKKLGNERLNANSAREMLKFKKDIQITEAKLKRRSFWAAVLKIGIGLCLFAIPFFLARRAVWKNKELTYPGTDVIEVEVQTADRHSSVIQMDDEKENEIFEKLMLLEKKLYYLNADFNLQTAAKKIKTNTTYLSYVVNKKLGKSFSEYSNELKINYAKNELASNPVYRKYSTQAIAESVGYKNAVSFTKSFSKRVGLSPTQYLKKIEKKD